MHIFRDFSSTTNLSKSTGKAVSFGEQLLHGRLMEGITCIRSLNISLLVALSIMLR